ncbi:MAG: diaminopimelate decarboxylase [Rhodospirillaceae bacterium]|jgi:diaminopimelate decarboxylase|nr:diaminopimelate decarboxylase [Rhodospirillaceae bacterium]MBT4220122.1 diaminopimelate decarboxylase [Rhodospirillaceae bacterium]MBT4464870.1 diaminopimelate decarboxylase [Rhodospirillaceae bacterium]MBT5013625.1 diaminopimelate decarboxylase [Rhodospirillaceae bacterium]MBT5307884.1 diaminopimelate decarboxylase [Rhodospirillaceae bacterium]
MDHFQYQNGRLSAEDVALADIAEDVGTPFYAYSTATLERHFQNFADAFDGLDATVCYSVKANSNLAVIRTLVNRGAGADVVSGGELKRALAAGVPVDKIVFSGVGKTDHELADALRAGIAQINVESEEELESLSAIAQDLGLEAKVALRVNPDVDANTHAKITTGKGENKFGIEWTRAHEVYGKATNLPGIRPVGLAVHIGSQLSEMQPFRDAYVRMRDLVAMLRADGLTVERLDLGGGLGIPYGDSAEPMPTPAEYADVVTEVLGDLGVSFTFEPGRVIVGNAGVLVTRVVYVKEGATRRFVIVDAAMNDLVRPAMYDAFHEIVPVAEPAEGAQTSPADIVGPVCETGDTFCKDRALAPLQAGDLLAIRSAGAYGASMASTYNTRPLVPEVLVNGGEYAVVRRRLEVDDLLDLERQPDWL